MTAAKPATTREERLAARLRENLRRRKAQARALEGAALADTESPDLPESGLPNPAP